MGSDAGDDDENPVHRVQLSGFAIGRTEVTQGQWRAVMGPSSKPSQSMVCLQPNCPVDSVSWADIQTFLERLSSKTGKTYRLPTEAEWEYACRAGSTADLYCGGSDLQRLAWYARNSDGHTHPVAQKQANAWGLFDMSGNVWEWVSDCYHPDYIGAPKDGSAWLQDECLRRMDRGGSFESEDAALRATNRSGVRSELRNVLLGFRVVRALP
jgi:formylglycine-generating enzyme required for sulfatase activity